MDNERTISLNLTRLFLKDVEEQLKKLNIEPIDVLRTKEKNCLEVTRYQFTEKEKTL